MINNGHPSQRHATLRAGACTQLCFRIMGVFHPHHVPHYQNSHAELPMIAHLLICLSVPLSHKATGDVQTSRLAQQIFICLFFTVSPQKFTKDSLTCKIGQKHYILPVTVKTFKMMTFQEKEKNIFSPKLAFSVICYAKEYYV